MFGEKAIKTHEMMVSFYEKKARQGGHDGEAYTRLAQRAKNQPAIAAFMLMVQAEMREHRTFFGGTHELWTLQKMNKVAWLLQEFMRGPALPHYVKTPDGERRKFHHAPSMMPYEIFNQGMEIYGSSVAKERAKDVFLAFIMGLFLGLSKGLEELGDELVQVEKLHLGN